jgi:hypothetical protein
MSDIFLSYKREDRPHARSLAEALQEAGWSVWWDPQLRAGEHFDDAIERELKSAKCVIVVWSKGSVSSQYVKDEAAYALDLNKLIPVTIDDVKPPFRYQRLQTESLAGWNGSQGFPAFKKILEDIASVIGGRPVKSRKRRSEKDDVSASSTKGLAVGGSRVKSRKRREVLASSTKGLAVGGSRVKSRKGREVIASSTKGLAVGPVKARKHREVIASSTKGWAERNEGILFDALRKLIREGTPYGFLIAAVGDYYVQFAREGEPKWLYAEAVSNAFLPANRQLTKTSADRLMRMGFEKPVADDGLFHRNYQIDDDDDLLKVARSAVTILRDVYGVAERSSLEIELNL